MDILLMILEYRYKKTNRIKTIEVKRKEFEEQDGDYIVFEDILKNTDGINEFDEIRVEIIAEGET
jgi:hypothetical protein